MLYWQYTEANSLDNAKIRGHFDALRARIPLSRAEYDEIMYIICDLCLEYGRLAFITILDPERPKFVSARISEAYWINALSIFSFFI